MTSEGLRRLMKLARRMEVENAFIAESRENSRAARNPAGRCARSGWSRRSRLPTCSSSSANTSVFGEYQSKWRAYVAGLQAANGWSAKSRMDTRKPPALLRACSIALAAPCVIDGPMNGNGFLACRTTPRAARQARRCGRAGQSQRPQGAADS
jgi:hypothetical protein